MKLLYITTLWEIQLAVHGIGGREDTLGTMRSRGSRGKRGVRQVIDTTDVESSRILSPKL